MKTPKPGAAEEDYLHILLVEDNKWDAKVLTSALEDTEILDAIVYQATSLSSALMRLATQQKFNLILLDLSLGDSQGVDTVKAIKKAAPNIPIIVLSGREDIEVALNSVRAGAQDFVVKTRKGVDVEMLSRVLLFADERSKSALIHRGYQLGVLRELTESSPPGTIPPPAPSAGGTLVEPHLDEIYQYIAKVNSYLQQNSPSSWEAVRKISENTRVPNHFHAIRSILKLEAPRQSSPDQAMVHTQPIATRALAAARAASRGGEDNISNEEDAQAAILAAIG